MALLSAKALCLGHGYPLEADFLKGFLHFVELEWLDDRFDLFHEKLSLRFSLEAGLYPLGQAAADIVPNSKAIFKKIIGFCT
jgi:hypothetical protein